MNTSQVKNFADDHLDFAINDLMEVIKIQKTFENPTIAQRTKLSMYHADLLLVVTEKAERNYLKNPFYK
jgi:hypothetical protein